MSDHFIHNLRDELQRQQRERQEALAIALTEIRHQRVQMRDSLALTLSRVRHQLHEEERARRALVAQETVQRRAVLQRLREDIRARLEIDRELRTELPSLNENEVVPVVLLEEKPARKPRVSRKTMTVSLLEDPTHE